MSGLVLQVVVVVVAYRVRSWGDECGGKEEAHKAEVSKLGVGGENKGSGPH